MSSKNNNSIHAITAVGILLITPAIGVSATNNPTSGKCAAVACTAPQTSTTLAERLCTIYSKIKSVTCDIRKTTKGSGHTIRMLSHVHYQEPNRIHVDNVSPVKRTIIADGERLYYHEAGVKKGFSKPINELSATWLAPLHNIPGTALEHLHHLRDLAEVQLPSSPEGYIRRGYQASDIYVVLSADSENRLHKIEFYKNDAMAKKTAEYIYTQFKEVINGCWIPIHHRATLFLPADEVVNETRRISNIAVNNTIPSHLFNHELFMKNVEFVDSFQETYQ